MTVEITADHRHHSGTLEYYRHASNVNECDMAVSVFVPPQAEDGPVPSVYWLSGLTCTKDYFTTKAGAYGVVAELGLIVVAPDSSPRGEGKPDDKAYDLGQGAGFYLDAPNPFWSTCFHMDTCTTNELGHAIDVHFPLDPARRFAMGHFIGGHRALTI